jgi:hypothetical protein
MMILAKNSPIDVSLREFRPSKKSTASGENGKKSMKNTIPDPAEPIGEDTIVADFLPPPEQLIPKKSTVQVMMELTQKSIEYFQQEVKQHNASPIQT